MAGDDKINNVEPPENYRASSEHDGLGNGRRRVLSKEGLVGGLVVVFNGS